MPYFTKTQLFTEAKSVLALSNLEATVAMANIRLNAEATTGGQLPPVPAEPAPAPAVTLDIFLAHSSLDQVQVLGLFRLLKQRGYSVYLDRVCDPQLDPVAVTRATARILRYRLAQCRSLFVATSVNTPSANWVPWELGFMDGWEGKAAIMPILEYAGAVFTGREYFELYPEVRDAGPNYTYPNDLDIYDRGNFVAAWSSWLTQTRSF